MEVRREHDLLGERDVPADVFYGVQTLRSLENFTLSGKHVCDYPCFVKGLAVTKQAAAEANYELGLLEKPIYSAIVQACKEIADGALHREFVVDMIQGGAGTSTNMNANEVIANRALEIIGHKKGDYTVCHPNNHVNLAQSTNDAYPTGARMGICFNTPDLIEALTQLVSSFRKKATEFSGHIKMGRTQLQDAVPMTLGQEFEGYAAALEAEIGNIRSAEQHLHTINMGATAIGTGLNSDPAYPPKVVAHLSKISGLDIHLADNLIAATNDTSDFLTYSAALKRLAMKISKISNDLRLLSSGPRAGIAEINLPPMQPGSSIMPGKVNPVIPEAMTQIAFRIAGNDTAVTMAAEAAQLELNVFEPLMIYSIFEGIAIMTAGLNMMRTRCIDGITANYDRCKDMVHHSIGLVTALNPVIGYEASSSIAKTALATGKSVYELVLEKKLLSKETLDEILKPENMTGPRKLQPQH